MTEKTVFFLHLIACLPKMTAIQRNYWQYKSFLVGKANVSQELRKNQYQSQEQKRA